MSTLTTTIQHSFGSFGYENIFEEIMVENVPNVEKEIVNQVQEDRSPIQDKPKEKHAKTY